MFVGCRDPCWGDHVLKLYTVCNFHPNIEIFNGDAWAQLSSLEDPELRRLAQSLPHTVLSCRADRTTKKYIYAFGR